MHSIRPGDATEWNLVLVHTLHPGTDVTWMKTAPAVLDTTYRLQEISNRAIL
ncbi:hypothetical protein AB0M54_37475 [Actinoplanes sp. NPDC051470]|uniref:hypothetical protein n=1 Tax=Actinoplanes sp. NPDC051470 TaxID=3157224 RepID=UPI00344AD44B